MTVALNSETIPQHRQQLIEQRDAGLAAQAQYPKVEKEWHKVADSWKRVQDDYTSRTTVRDELKRAIVNGEMAERKLLMHVPAEIDRYASYLDTLYRAKFAAQQDLAFKVPRAADERQKELKRALDAATKDLKAIEQQRSQLRERCMYEVAPELTSAEREAMAASTANPAALSEYLEGRPSQAAHLGTPGSSPEYAAINA